MIGRLFKNRSRVVIYTCITGGYDSLSTQPKQTHVNCNYVVYSDEKSSQHQYTGWEARTTENLEMLDNRLLSRKYKCKPHEYFSNYDFTIWIDGSVRIRSTHFASEMIKMLGGNDLAFIKHPERTDIGTEAKFCKQIDRFKNLDIESQVAHYTSLGFKDQVPLLAGGVIIRRNNLKVTSFNSLWFNEVKKWKTRDQLSLPFAIWKTGAAVKVIDMYLWDNEYFYVMESHNFAN